MKGKKLIIAIIILAIAGIAYYLLNNKASEDNNTNSQDTAPPASTVSNISFAVKKTLPHDTGSYTQGLTFYKGELYEGTGLNGRSRLMKVDLQTGKALKTHALEDKYFGEGIAILNDTIYQLTWENQVVFVYTLPEFKKVKEFKLNTEGWGITTDGKQLIVTDGSNNLYFYEPSNFNLIKTIAVKEDNYPAKYLNELEYIDGYVYANQYTSPFIFKIDMQSGTVVGKLNLSELWQRVKTINPAVDVPNGIAYDEITKKVYITGKLWPELYEIEFSK